MQLVARVQLCVAFSQRSDELGLQLTTLCFCGDLISGMPFRPKVSILSTLLFLKKSYCCIFQCGVLIQDLRG